MDPLSDVLALLKPRSYMAGGFDVGGDWSIRFARHDGIKCYALVSGHCWLAVDGVAEPVRVEPGDCFLLPRGFPFRLASDLALPATDASALYATPLYGRVAVWNGGGDCFGVGGHFILSGSHARMLLDELPPIVHIRSESGKAALRWSLERMREEIREQRPGSSLVAQQLATMMLVQALRLHLSEDLQGRSGWLAALGDSQMCAAISTMHSEPGQRWTLERLAERCGMSRSIFALRFKATVGVSPMEYLTRWRMLVAGDRLTASNDAVSAIALSLGYDSESAFSKAFRRVMQCSPRQYRRGQNDSSENSRAQHSAHEEAPTHEEAVAAI